MLPQSHLSHPKYRPDIDGLRAIAVLSVVAFHAYPSSVKGGFIGVDVFFVISGFLISTIIFQNLEKGTFSFAEFYARRIKRIFPALLIVLVASYAFGWFALFADEYKQLGKHIAAGAGFVSNIVLWNDAGYFDNSADTKPLLHLWSLGIEEQFYIVWPLLLWLAWKRKFNLLLITILVAVVSFTLNVKGVSKDAVATFYSPQTRFWELLSGSLLAWLTLYKKDSFKSIKSKIHGWFPSVAHRAEPEADRKALLNVVSLVGFLFLVYGVYRINKYSSFPGVWGLVPVTGAVLIILAGSKAWLNRVVLSNRIMVWFGLISFPLYLWHWPLLSFARIVEGEIPNKDIRSAAVLISILLAWLTYKLVERPIRLGRHARSKTFSLALLMAVMGYVGYRAYSSDTPQIGRGVGKHIVFVRELKWSHWEDAKCVKKFGIGPCQYSNENLKLMIIGDSHGNHLYPGLAKTIRSDYGVISAGTCLPLVGITFFVNKNQASHPCAKTDFLSANLKILDANPSISTVILSSFFRPVLDGGLINPREKEFWGGIRLESSLPQERGMAPDELVYLGLKRTIHELVRRGKVVVFVRDTPDFELDIRDICLKRFSMALDSECSLPRSVFEKRRVKETILVDKLQTDFPTVKFVDPFAKFCTIDTCFLTSEGKPLFRDQHHLSEFGSLFLANYLVQGYLKDFSK